MTPATRRLVTVAVVGCLAVAHVLGCQWDSACGATPCPPPFVLVSAPCGVKSITSTCRGFSRDAGACASNCTFEIPGVAAETCTIDVVYGNGATTSATVSFVSDDCCGVHVKALTKPIAVPPGCEAPDASATDAN